MFNRVLQGESIDTIRQELIDIAEGFFTKEDVGYLGHINIYPTALPKNGNQFDTFFTFTREFFHALGMLSLISNCEGNLGECFIDGFLNIFSDHLYMMSKSSSGDENS